MGKKNIPDPVVKSLWGNSHNMCSNCRKFLSDKDENGKCYTTAAIAHIEGENPDSARYNINMTDSERSAYDNLILLCPNCHSMVDGNTSEYTVEKIKQIKLCHEKWFNDALKSNIPDITFAELDVIIKYLCNAKLLSEDQYSLVLVPPKDKIKKNNLSARAEQKIIIGYSLRSLVKNYLNMNPDILFGERLRAGFVRKYEELKAKGLTGEEIFWDLFNFSSNNCREFNYSMAGLGVLVYFFEICEVLEK
jgi:hypothetical protein